MTNQMNSIDAVSYSNGEEISARNQMYKLLKNTPIPEDQILENLPLYINSKSLSRILFMDQIYKKIINKVGIILEFGTRWGPNLAQFAALRGIYEPFNRHRKIVGLDTFEGFPNVDIKDGKSNLMRKGNLSMTEEYDTYLNNVMRIQEKDNPLSHIKKYEIIKGDACETLPVYLDKNPETIIALAYFDFDIYKPTKECLELIRPRLTKGSILGFDEINDHDSPGETIALMEVFGLNNIKLRRYKYVSRTSYFVVE